MSELEQIKSELLECAQAWDGDSRLLGNVRADEIVKLLHAFDFAGWTSEVPMGKGEYMFTGVGLETDKIPLQYAKIEEVTLINKEKALTANFYDGKAYFLKDLVGLWFPIHYPKPPKD